MANSLLLIRLIIDVKSFKEIEPYMSQLYLILDKWLTVGFIPFYFFTHGYG